jgi:predicted AlkP superfamily phosphohydrolase/phosphomutase
VYFNDDLVTKDNLAARGVEVQAGEQPKDALIRYLTGGEIRSADGKQKFPIDLFPLSGDYGGDDPDMVVNGAYDGYSVEFWNLKRPRGAVVWELMESEAHDHERDGVYFMWGKYVKQNFDAGVRRIEDIAPTMLYLLGLPVASDMDGRPIYDALNSGYVAGHEGYFIKDYNEIPRETVVVEKDTEPLEKKLKSLGYVR